MSAEFYPVGKTEHPHTPTPWGIERTPSTNWIGPLRKNSHKVDRIVVHTDRDGLKDDAIFLNDADADFIVKAVNNYDRLESSRKELLEALWERYADHEYMMHTTNNPCDCPAWEATRKAIKNAEQLRHE